MWSVRAGVLTKCTFHLTYPDTCKWRFPYDMLDLSSLSPGQRCAMEALIGGGESARTYSDAAQIAGVSEGTMLTHVNRVHEYHPVPYQS